MIGCKALRADYGTKSRRNSRNNRIFALLFGVLRRSFLKFWTGPP